MSVAHEEMRRLLDILPAAARDRMCSMYVESLAAQVVQLEAALASDTATATQLAHKVAGSAAMMQDHQLSRPARSLEGALRDGATDQVAVLWPQVRLAMQATLDWLRNRMAAA